MNYLQIPQNNQDQEAKQGISTPNNAFAERVNAMMNVNYDNDQRRRTQMVKDIKPYNGPNLFKDPSVD